MPLEIRLYLAVARLRLFPRWLVTCAWRSPARAVAAAAVAVMVAGMAVVVVNGPGNVKWATAKQQRANQRPKASKGESR